MNLTEHNFCPTCSYHSAYCQLYSCRAINYDGSELGLCWNMGACGEATSVAEFWKEFSGQ